MHEIHNPPCFLSNFMFPLKKEGMEIPANDLWFLLSVPWKAFSSILLRLKENWTVKQSRSPKALMSSRIRQVTWLAHIHSFCHWFEQPFRKIALWGGHTFISWLLMGAGSTSLCAGWGGGWRRVRLKARPFPMPLAEWMPLPQESLKSLWVWFTAEQHSKHVQHFYQSLG